MQTPSKQEELEALRAKVEQLEAEVALPTVPQWEISRDYPMYYAAGGFLLGLLGAMISLLFNVDRFVAVRQRPDGSGPRLPDLPAWRQSPATGRRGAATAYAIPDSVIIALGCCLYLATGMLLGIPVCLAIRQFAPRSPLVTRGCSSAV